MNEPRLHVMVGMPASGKSTLAATMLDTGEVDLVICPDSIRVELTGDINEQSENDKVFRLAHERTLHGLQAGHNVCFDATNLSLRARNALFDALRLVSADVLFHVMMIDPGVCRARNVNRWRFVPDHVMDKMEAQFFDSVYGGQLAEHDFEIECHWCGCNGEPHCDFDCSICRSDDEELPPCTDDEGAFSE